MWIAECRPQPRRRTQCQAGRQRALDPPGRLRGTRGRDRGHVRPRVVRRASIGPDDRSPQYTDTVRIHVLRRLDELPKVFAKRFTFFAGGRVDYHQDAANERSPLFRDDLTYSVGAGLIWSFFQSERTVDE